MFLGFLGGVGLVIGVVAFFAYGDYHYKKVLVQKEHRYACGGPCPCDFCKDW